MPSSSATCKDLSHLKKYRIRNSPPRSAEACRGKVMLGNDGKPYKPVIASNNVARWAPYKKKGKSSSSSSPSKKAIAKAKPKARGGSAKGVTPLTLKQVKAGIPKNATVKYTDKYPSLKIAHDFYGPSHVKILTTKLAESLQGKTIVVLQGQAWNYGNASLSSRERSLQTMQLYQISKKTKDLKVKLGSNTFEMYVSKGKYVTGSGADPVFVFVK